MKLFTSILRKVVLNKKSNGFAVQQQASYAKQIKHPPAEASTKSTATSQIVQLFFGKYLLVTNTVSSGLLMFAGDLMSQEIEYRKGNLTKRYDWTRSGKMFLVGSLKGPIYHSFYGWLDRTVVGGTTAWNVTTKIFLDQIIMSPISIIVFFYPAGWLDGQTTRECNEEMKLKFLKVYLADWLVWPPTQFINFVYLDQKYRVVYVNFITMLFNVFLSYTKYEDAVPAATTVTHKDNENIRNTSSVDDTTAAVRNDNNSSELLKKIDII